jgi:hypothetical protein
MLFVSYLATNQKKLRFTIFPCASSPTNILSTRNGQVKEVEQRCQHFRIARSNSLHISTSKTMVSQGRFAKHDPALSENSNSNRLDFLAPPFVSRQKVEKILRERYRVQSGKTATFPNHAFNQTGQRISQSLNYFVTSHYETLSLFIPYNY